MIFDWQIAISQYNCHFRGFILALKSIKFTSKSTKYLIY